MSYGQIKPEIEKILNTLRTVTRCLEESIDDYERGSDLHNAKSATSHAIRGQQLFGELVPILLGHERHDDVEAKEEVENFLKLADDPPDLGEGQEVPDNYPESEKRPKAPSLHLVTPPVE